MPKRSENDPEVVEGNLVMQTKTPRDPKLCYVQKQTYFITRAAYYFVHNNRRMFITIRYQYQC